MNALIDWVSRHTLASILIAVSAYAILYVILKRKDLFYRQ